MAEAATPSRRRRRAGGGRGTASTASSSSSLSSRNRFDADGDEGFISTAGKDTDPSSSSRTNGKSKSKIKGSATMPPSSSSSSSSSLKSASSSANSTAATSSAPKAPSRTGSRKDRPSSSASASAPAPTPVSNVCADAKTIESALREANDAAGNMIPSSSLLKIIARASAVASDSIFGSSNDINDQQHAQVFEGIIVLEEKVGDVLSVVKKCLRVATSGSASSSSSSKTPKKSSSSRKAENTIAQDEKAAHLRLAVHCLRAVCPLIASAVISSGGNAVGKREGQMIENAIRLLYHAIVASEDVFTGAPASTSSSSSSLVVRMDAAGLCLSSCAVLSHLLNRLGMARRGFVEKGCIDVDNVRPPSPLLVVLMNVPTDRLGEVGPMTAVQLAKIGAQSLLSSCTVLASLFVDTTVESSAISSEKDGSSSSDHQRLGDEFGFLLVDANIMSRSTENCREMPISSFQLLIRSVAPSWLNVLVNDASKEGIDGALSYTKRYQRLLWDTAARLDKKVSKMSSRSKGKEVSDGDMATKGGLHISRLVLCLRGDSILVSLAMPSGVDASHHELQIDITSSADLRAAILEDRLSHGCECAWKSATTYAQGVAAAFSLDPTWYGGLGRPDDANRANEYALVQFHQRVGGTIDALVQARLSCRSKTCDQKALPPPFSYIEYCANRAIHVGPERQRVATKIMEGHDDKENSAGGSAARMRNDHLERSSCDHDGCIFSSLPFYFVHDQGLPFSTLLDSAKSKEMDDDFLCGSAALSIVFAALQAVDLVYAPQSSRETRLHFDGEIVSVFNTFFLSSIDRRRLKVSLMNQCQKIVAPLKLNSRVVHISKFVNSRYCDRSVDPVTISGANLLQRVIGDCYAPLLSLIASAEAKASLAESSSSKVSRRLEMAQDCYIRAAMLADHLDAWTSKQPSGSSDFKASADQAIRRAYKLAVGSSDENAIMVAKSIGAIGKQRIERQDMTSATVPMLLSSEIFASMFEKSRSSSYKLPIRFQQLSSLFESAGMPNEAMASLAFAIHYKMREFTKNNDDHNEANELNVGRTILRCVEVIGGGEGPFTVQSSSDGRPESSTITSCQFFSRLMRLYVKFYRRSRCEEESLATTPCATLVDITNRSRIGKTLEKALCLESSESRQPVLPVYRVFQLLIMRSGVSGLDAIAQVTFLNRALYMFGRVLAGEVASIQNDSNDNGVSEGAHDEVKEWITEQLSREFTGFLKLALTCASKGRGDVISEQQYRQYESFIYLSASASFFIHHIDSAASEKAKGDYDLPNLRRSAIKYAEKAKSLLRKALDEDGGRNDCEKLLLCAQQLAVDYYFMEVSRNTRPEQSLEASLYKDWIETMEDIVGRLYNLEDCQNIADINSFFSFALARMNSELQMVGNSTLAIRAAALITRLQDSACSEKPTPDSSDQALAMSNLISSLSEGGFHGACRSLLQGFFSRYYSCGLVDDFGGTLTAATNAILAKEDISINEIDLLATALLVHVQSSAPEYHGSSCQFLNDVIEVVRDQEDCEDASSWVHVRWILSTCQISIAQQMEKAGDVPRSLDAYKDCSRSCRSALAFLRSPTGQSAAANIDPSTILHPHNIMLHFSVRLSQCLRDASSLYCRQGNYSKGEGYALSLVETMNALPNFTTKTSKRGASDLMSLLEASSEDDSVRRADALQFFVEIQAYSRDAAMVSSELQDRGSNLSAFVDDNNVPEKVLQNVRSTMRYGDIVARGIESGGVPAFLSYHDQSYATMLQISSQDFFDEGCIPIIDDSLDNDLEMEQFEHLMSETRLRQANRLEVDIVGAPTENGDKSNASSSSSLYRIVSESGYTSGLSRARSYYHIGLDFLADARRNGELNQLWEGSSQFVGGGVPTCDTSREGPSPTASFFSSIASARESFTKAAALAGPASTLLSRQVMRCLALVTGPDNETSAEIGYTATALVHSSVGSTQRQKVSQAFTRRTVTECNDSRLGLLFGALDTALHDRSLRNAAIQSIYDEACSVLPADWRFVAFASCPTGELLVSVIYFNNDNSGQRGVASETICIFPRDEQCSKTDLPFSPITPSIYEGILKPFDDIMERSRSQLKDMDSSSLDRYYETEKKRMWWEEREAIDEQLQEVIQEVEGKYFSSDALQRLILGPFKNSQSDGDPNGGDYVATMCQGFEDSDNEEELECSLGNLADKFEAACAVMDDNVVEGDSELEDEDDTPGSEPAPEKMTVVQIKEELQSLGIDKSEFKQMRKAALVNLLQEKREQHVRNTSKPGKMRKKRISATSSPCRRSMAEAKTSSMSSYQEPNGSAASACIFLVLDEDLQRFPFEGFNCMEARSICRVPSISFAIATLIERGQRRIRADNTKYVLDPEANLSSTKRTMLSALDALTSKFKWTWKGVAGKIPSADFMEAALTSQSGLFLYCGHGGGEKCFSRKQVEGLLMTSERTGRSNASSGAGGYDHSSDDEYEHSPRRCSSAILLMGCSSGRLVSINSSRSSPPKNLSLEYEPEGMALSYLCAGAPCVVGNLWDVTDRDIDRFCLALLEDFLDPRGDVSKSLPQCVAQARSVCKMRHIVGAAPVVYGVPVVAEKVG